MGKSNSKGNFMICGKQNKKEKEISNFTKENIPPYENEKTKKEILLNNSKMLCKESSSTNYKTNSTADFSLKLKKENQLGKGNLDNNDTEIVIDLSKVETLSKSISPNSHFDSKNFSRKDNHHSTVTTTNSRFMPNKNGPNSINLNSFECIKVIGRGTFGKVILVKNKTDEKLYAMKCLNKLHILKTNNLINLKNEKRILKNISHPFIIKLHDTFQDSNKVYMLFEYYNGGELFFHLQKYLRFTEDMVKFYGGEIYLAILHLHKNNIIYRDLKPENVVLDEQGHVKLIDFGLSKDEITIDSRCSTFCGTNEYIPPEVVKGGKYNFNFDWWGFGVLIYELLFGAPPFRSGNKSNLFRKICHLNPDFNLNSIRISPEAENLLKSLLNKDPSKRIKPENIPAHPFFNRINFNDLVKLKIKPPFKPRTKSKEDMSNIDPLFLKEKLFSPVKNLKYEVDHNKFSDF